MSTSIDEIDAFLDTLGLGNITRGSMPATPDAIGTLYEYGGQPAERRFGVVGMGYEKPAFQLVFRGAPGDYNGPRVKCETAIKALMAVQPGKITATSAIYLTIDPQQSPFPVQPADNNNRHYIGFNFYATKEPSV